MVAGLGDGTVYQMTPEGVVKGEIPRPPLIDKAIMVRDLNNVFSSFIADLGSFVNHLAREQCVSASSYAVKPR